MSLNRTGIETADFTWNLYTGCLRGCSFCYARKLARGRLKRAYLKNNNTSPLVPQGADPADPFFPRFWEDRKGDPYKVPKRFRSKNPHLPPGTAMIFTIDMGDIFGPSIPAKWTSDLMEIIRDCPQIFQILTKFPNNLLDWVNSNGLPENVWAGVTINNQSMVESALHCLSNIDASVKYICVEPLQGKIKMDFENVDWMIIGAQTNPLVQPEKQWVEELLNEAHRHNAKIFMKKSLKWPETYQEFPKGGS